ncbi:MAG: phosphogluconate dehydrogenase (NAD(+)-dependent, decarboxylating) [Patescibacteria group bacterium]
MQLGFIGLGKMGSRMASKLLRERHDVVVWNRSKKAVEELKTQNSKLKITPLRQGFEGQATQKLKVAKTIEELVKSLEKPRVIWVMVTAGEATENVLQEIGKFVEKDDVIIDGGNSYFKDTQRRYEELKTKNIKFLGLGVSGGIIAATNGYPLMAGGDKSAYDYIKPVLDSLAKPNGAHEYFGEGGAGHFVKMIHNGIEYGIMQSLGEGFGVLEKAPYKLDLLRVAGLWQKGTLVSGFMLDRVVEVLSKDQKLQDISGVIEESGEAGWTVEQAKEEGVPIEIIEKSLEFRRRSQKDSRVSASFAAKMIAVLRQVFGGHEVKKR